MGSIRSRNVIVNSERGAALVIALFIIAVLTVLGILVLNTSIVEIKMATNQRISSQVFYAAEAGLERGLKSLIEDFENDSAGWANNTWATAATVTMTDVNGSTTFDVATRSMDMYLDGSGSTVRKLTFPSGQTLGNATYELYLHTPSATEAYLMAYSSGMGGVAAVEYHLKVDSFSPLNNAIFTGAGITGHFQGSVDLAGSVYSRGNMTPTGSLGFYNNYADAPHGLGSLSGVIPNVTDLDAKIRVKGGDFILGGSAQVGTTSANGAYSGIYVDGTTNVSQGVNSYADEYSTEVPDVPLPTIRDGLDSQFTDAWVNNCIASEGYTGADSNKAREVYSDWASGTGCFAGDDSTGVVINGDVSIAPNTGSFSTVDAYGNGLSWDKASGTVTIQGNVVINGAFTFGNKNANLTYVAVGPAGSSSASDPEAGATLFVRDNVNINGPFLGDGGYCQGGAGTNTLGVITPGTVTFTGKPGNAYTGFYYAETQINFNKQAKFGGTVIGGVVNFAQVPDVFQVPALMQYTPPAIPGMSTTTNIEKREWRRVY